jgi:hypothetical protein
VDLVAPVLEFLEETPGQANNIHCDLVRGV